MDINSLMMLSPEDKQRSLSMGLLQGGLGILANNTGNYGAFGPAFGRGAQQGLLAYQDELQRAPQQRMQQYLLKSKMDEAQQRRIEEEKRQALLSQYGPMAQLFPEKFAESQFRAPTLVETADPDDPLRTVKKWLQPGAVDGPVIGQGVAPKELDPRIQAAKLAQAAAGATRVDNKITIPTEGERTSASFLNRMEFANNMLDSMPPDAVPPIESHAMRAFPLIGDYMANVVMSPKQQAYFNATQEWVRAKLRKESGAAIPTGEFFEEYRTYFPMPGDSPEVIQQKSEFRKSVERSMSTMAGRAYMGGNEKPKTMRGNSGRPPLSSFQR